MRVVAETRYCFGHVCGGNIENDKKEIFKIASVPVNIRVGT
jgi:hypothetical protein